MAQNKTPKPDTVEVVESITSLGESESALAREKENEREDLLSDMPALKSVTRLRMREQNRFTEVMLYVRPKMEAMHEKHGEGDLDEDDMDPETVRVLLEVCAMVDEFAESIALDKDAYVEWAENKRAAHFMALFYQFAEALGN